MIIRRGEENGAVVINDKMTFIDEQGPKEVVWEVISGALDALASNIWFNPDEKTTRFY